MMISLQKSSKLVFVLLFSSITIFFGKTAGAEISATSEDASVLITNLEYLRLVSGSQKQLPQVTDLANTNFPVKSCPPNRMSQAESNSNRQELDPQDPPPVPQHRVDELEIDKKSPTKKPPEAEQEYIITPTVADEKKIHPRTTTIPMNGVLINHLTQRELSVGSRFGNNQNTTFDINGLVKLNGQVQENLTTNNIFTVEQTGEYLQLQTVRQKREITVNLKEPRTVLGTELQLSITASCILPGANPNQICTYTPGLKSADINPDTQTPNRILQTVCTQPSNGYAVAETVYYNLFAHGMDIEEIDAHFKQNLFSLTQRLSVNDRVGFAKFMEEIKIRCQLEQTFKLS